MATKTLLSDLLENAGIGTDSRRKALVAARLNGDDEATVEQRGRASKGHRPKGLRGLALATYILTGEGIAEQVTTGRQRKAREQRSNGAAMYHRIAEDLGCAPELVGSIAKGLRGKGEAEIRAAVQARLGEQAREAATTEPAAAEAATEPAAAERSTGRGPREGSAMHAAVTILADADGPMRPRDIYEAAVERGLAGSLKGKTPVATLAAQMAVANKNGRWVERTAPGKYQLRREAA